MIPLLMQFSSLAGTGAVALGCLILFCWLANHNGLFAVPAGLLAVHPATSLLFILSGASLRLSGAKSVRQRQAGQVSAGVLLFLITAVPLSWFGLLFPGTGAGAMQLDLLASLSLFGAGLALLILDMEWPQGFWPAQYLCIAGLSLGLLTLVGYGYGIKPLFHQALSFDVMQLNIALAIAILSLGILCVRPERGIMALAISQGPGGSTVRVLLPAMIIIPTSLAAIRLAAANTGLYSSVSGSTAFGMANMVVFAVLILWNASSLQRISAEQNRSKQQAEALLFSISDGILMLDEKGLILLANRRLREFLDLSPALAIEGRSLREVMPDSNLRKAVLQACVEPRPNVFREIDLSTDERRLFLRISAVPVLVPETGAKLGVITAVRDATFEKDLDKMKEDFLHDITHDLRNPVGSALGFVDVLLKGTVGELNPDQRSMLGSIKRSASRLMGMINNILDLAKMEAGGVRMDLRPSSLTVIANRAITEMEPLARPKKIKLVLEAAAEHVVMADADLLERVVINLVGNAIKFTPEAGSVTVRITDGGPTVEVQVADTGEGIAPADQERIFQKFEQVARQRRGGTGLGLAIVKGFVEAHRGRIWVESHEGQGSRFTFTVPKGLAKDEKGDVVRPVPQPARKDGQAPATSQPGVPK
ncbi:MAG: PAS domain-containing sensor histidine kinase [Elusimicrobia bacterium]|nr:PAS domain-containing sensor histidine kinase [Elusimicrobiota bacterium]